jgi:hypothetical protein
MMHGPVYVNVFNCLCVGSVRVLLVLCSFPRGRQGKRTICLHANEGDGAFASASEQLTDPVFCPLADLHVQNSDSQCYDPSC